MVVGEGAMRKYRCAEVARRRYAGSALLVSAASAAGVLCKALSVAGKASKEHHYSRSLPYMLAPYYAHRQTRIIGIPMDSLGAQVIHSITSRHCRAKYLRYIARAAVTLCR